MKQIKVTIVGIIALIMLIFGTILTYGATDYTEINGGTIAITYQIRADAGLGEVEVKTQDDRFVVESTNFSGAGSSWKPGEIPKVQVILTAQEGYGFSTKINTAKITIKGKATSSGIKRLESGKKLEVNLRLNPVAGTMGQIEDAFWVGSPLGKAKWDPAQYAGAYELKLFRDGTVVKRIEKVNITNFDFYPYMTKVGTYIFHVRPIPKSSNEATYLPAGEWQVSDELFIDRQYVSTGITQNMQTPEKDQNDARKSGWKHDGKGWWYLQDDGRYPVNQWSYIDEKWYLFDMAGYIRIGWQKRDDKFYYLTVNGDMVTGWLEDNRIWYYLGEDGSMRLGWQLLNGQWYYFHGNGSMATGWNHIGNQSYYLDPVTGAMAANTWIGAYYVNQDGVWIP